MPREHGRCVVCERLFTLTRHGTVPGHRGRLAPACAGSYKHPKPAAVVAR